MTTSTKKPDQTLELDAADFIDESSSAPISMAPVVVDAAAPPDAATSEPMVPSADTTVSLRHRARARVTRGLVVSVSLCVVVFCAVAVRAQSATPAPAFGYVAAASRPAAAPPPRVVDSTPWAPVTTPWAPVTAGSTESTWGTISAAGGAAPLIIDGARATGQTAVVACGRHDVRAGRSKSRSVDIPCGRSVTIDALGRVRDASRP